ncbi:iron chelate uptake ABC transporter family permease subunit [Micromonospora sp. NPDC005324]|uniref:FecCD family ABC transporter permease n=1 Tax=Micromonospora sp. NPDC005324 TaxID=3157033 RepID=UPI0033A764DB
MAVRVGTVSVVLRPRPLIVTALASVAAVGLALWSMTVGELPLSPGEVAAAFTGDADAAVTYIVVDVRLPRLVLAVLAGAAFGLAGAVLQSVTGNPLASPDLLGVAAGAGAAAVTCIVLGFDGSAASLSLFALAGGLLTAATVFGLAWRGGMRGTRMLLVGIGLGAVGNAVTSLLIASAGYEDAARATTWLIGDLSGRGWGDVHRVGWALLVAGPPTLLVGRSLRSLRLGDAVAAALGVRITRARVALLLLAVVLTACATAGAGPIAFVGLLAPLIAARASATAETPLVASAATGALLVLVSDLVARSGPLGLELPVGAVTAVLGAVALLLILHRANTA